MQQLSFSFNSELFPCLPWVVPAVHMGEGGQKVVHAGPKGLSALRDQVGCPVDCSP